MFTISIDLSHQKAEVNPCIGVSNYKKIRDQETCTSYYLCVHEVAYNYTCDNGKWFEESVQDCVAPRQSSCFPPAPEGYCHTILNFQMLESPHAFDEYYVCINEEPYYTRCNGNLKFDQGSQSCISDDEDECSSQVIPNPPVDICIGVANFIYVSSLKTCIYRLSDNRIFFYF